MSEVHLEAQKHQVPGGKRAMIMATPANHAGTKFEFPSVACFDCKLAVHAMLNAV